MNSDNVNYQTNIQISAYRPIHAIAALIALFMGYMFIRWFGLPARQALAAFIYSEIFALLTLALTLICYIPRRKLPTVSACLLLFAELTLPAVYLMGIGIDITRPVCLFFLFSYPMYYYLAFGSEDGKVGNGLFFDLIKAVLVMPFASFLSIFPAIISPLNGKKAGKRIAYVFIGILIAFIPAVIVICLLRRADPAFSIIISNILGTIFGNSPDELIINFWIFSLSLPISMYLFGMFFSNQQKRCSDVLSTKKKKNASESIAKLPVLTVCSAIIPLLAIYLLFFVSQIGYFISAFDGAIPDGYTVSEYARQGFFELCSVSTINLGVVVFATAFSKRNGEKPATAIRVLNSVLSVFTLVLIATAMRKMMLYIETFGFTPLRVMTSWFMILLAIVFALVIIKQIKPRFNAVGISFKVSVIMLCILCLSNPDARVAEANVWLYQTGRLETCDIEAFGNLSDSALPYMIPLLSDSDPEIAQNARRIIDARLNAIDTFENSWMTFSPGSMHAKKQLINALEALK